MSKENNLTDFLTDVANAIREKKGTTENINPQNFSDEIRSIGGGVIIEDSVDDLDPNAQQGSLASVAVNTISEVPFSELYQPTSDEVNMEAGVINTTNLSRVSGISVNSSYDTSIEIQDFAVYLFSKDIDVQGGVGQVILLVPMGAMTMNFATQEQNQLELFTPNEDGTLTVNEENLAIINNLLSSTEFVYGGVMSDDPSCVDIFYKTIGGIQKTDLYIKDVRGWKVVGDEELKAKVDNLQTTVDNLKSKTGLIVHSVYELPENVPLGALASVVNSEEENSTLYIKNINGWEQYSELVDGSVTTEKVADEAIVFDKLSIDVQKVLAFAIQHFGIIIFKDKEVETICLTNWDTNSDGLLTKEEASTVTDIGRVFENNNKIVSFDELSNFTNLTSIPNNAFFNCSSLTAINIPEGVTSIGNSAFSSCSSLESVTLPESVTSIGEYAFYHCRRLTSITIPEGVTSIEDGAFNDCSSLTSITIPESVTSIGSSAFKECSSITSIVIPDGVTSIGGSAFYDCTNLITITIPESVTSIGYSIFNGTSWYNNQSDGVVYINNILYGYKGTMPVNTSIDVKEGTICIGGGAFRDCTNLISINLPDSVTSIGNSAFDDCEKLTSITIPASVTSIGDSAFYECSSLTAVTIPENSQLTSIGNSAFLRCSKLTAINIPEGVMSIGRSAFSSCDNLTSINLPSSVTSVGSDAFWGCSDLTYIHSYATTPPVIGNSIFTYTSTKMIIYVPDESVDVYKRDGKWSVYTDRIKPMSEYAEPTTE